MLTPNDIEEYFAAEKQAGMAFLIIGVIAVVLGVVFIFVFKTAFYKGAAIPLIAIGLIQGIAGATVFRRSDQDRIRNVYAYTMNPAQLREKELPRMIKVNRNFRILKVVEIIFIITGLLLIILFRTKPGFIVWKGIGITLLLQSILVLGADILAEKRALIYTRKLAEFVANKLTALN
jgi:membrane protein implicated in regulation of membrane protease activity